MDAVLIKIVTCVECVKSFQQKQSLSRHKTSHHGTAKFTCQNFF